MHPIRNEIIFNDLRFQRFGLRQKYFLIISLVRELANSQDMAPFRPPTPIKKIINSYETR